MASAEILVDGSMAWGGGVDSIKVPTISGPNNPDGLDRNQNAWLVNAIDRDTGLTQRSGWQPLGLVAGAGQLYQGGIVYSPIAGDPYLLCVIGGHIYSVTFSSPPVVTDLTLVFAQVPITQTLPRCFFVQAEEFVVIQWGDLVSNPFFYDGVQLWQSNGIINPGSVDPNNELPPGGPMVYYQQRIWIAQWNGLHRVLCAGDIVGNQASGTAPYGYRDSVLKVTECPLAFGTGGDGFAVPSQSGDIRALAYSANLDATLGQGNLMIFTRGPVYTLDVPITRTDWIATTSNKQPTMKVIQLTNGSVNDRSIVAANGDLFFQTITGDIGSISTALKYFQQWGNTPVSSNEHKIVQRQNKALLQFVSGINFDNRLLMSALPKQLENGVVCDAIIPLDLTPINSFGKGATPAWQGHWEGLQWLQLFVADFGGLDRAFGLTVGKTTSEIDLWEITEDAKEENGDNRVTWISTGPAFDFGSSIKLKKLVSLELWFDRLWGTVDFAVYYTPDQYPCPILWSTFTECAARNSIEDITFVNQYPPATDYREQYRIKVLPTPEPAECNILSSRPLNVARQFQITIVVTGFCRIRGIFPKTLPVERSLYEDMITCR